MREGDTLPYDEIRSNSVGEDIILPRNKSPLHKRVAEDVDPYGVG